MSSLTRTGAVLFLIALTSAPGAVAATTPQLLHEGLSAQLRRAPLSGKLVVTNVRLGRESLDSLELEPMRVWADDATITVHDGPASRTVAPPATRFFKGRVTGNEESAIFLALEPNGQVSGMALVDERRLKVATGRRVRTRSRDDQAPDPASAPVFFHEVDYTDDITDPAANWSCEVDRNEALSSRIEAPDRLKQAITAGSQAGASYTLRLAIETDNELCAAFGNDPTAVANYLATLVGQASVVYQRDLKTTLLIGNTQIRNGGAGTDPWTGTSASLGLAEVGRLWHNDATLAAIPRSSVVMISGKGLNSGVAWLNTLCDADFACGADGARCGGASYANSYAGGYAFCGSLASGITTNVPDPTASASGVQYSIPNNGNFWMLIQFMHELGHNANSPHTHCVPLTAAEQTQLNAPGRPFVDVCYSGEPQCYSGGQAAPAELGTIMSYCHNLLVNGFRASRFLFHKAGEPSAKMLGYLNEGLELATPDPAITTAAEPIACTSGRTASVAPCAGCTYSWAISGGTITSASDAPSLTYTPSAEAVTLTVTVTAARGCGITLSKTVAATCILLDSPLNVVATASGAASVTVSWIAVNGATGYTIMRREAGGMFGPVGTALSTSFSDTTVLPDRAYMYRVRATNASGSSQDSVADFATTVSFTDPTITPGVTTCKSAHVSELRTAVDALERLAGIPNTPYPSPAITASTIGKVDMDELRSRLVGARIALGAPAQSWTDSPISAGGTTVKAAHVIELRAGVQ